MSGPSAVQPPARRLWLVRHAQPLVAPGVCYGRQDVPADADATRTCARALAPLLPQGSAVHHSTLQRCELLALTLQALRPDLTLKPDPRLRELDFGLWEGQAWDAIGEDAVAAWTDAFATHRPGGGDSLVEMLERVAAALQSARNAPVADVVWITHAGVARCVDWLLTHGSALPQAADWPMAAPGYGQWVVRDLAG